MKKFLALLIILAAAITACGGSDGSGGVGHCSGGIICGQWVGTWTSQAGQGSGVLLLTMSQDRHTVTAGGYFNIGGVDVSCQGSGAITEEKSDGEIILNLTFPSTGQTAQLTGAYNNLGMAGNYTRSNGDHGRFVLTKNAASTTEDLGWYD